MRRSVLCMRCQWAKRHIEKRSESPARREIIIPQLEAQLLALLKFIKVSTYTKLILVLLWHFRKVVFFTNFYVPLCHDNI